MVPAVVKPTILPAVLNCYLKTLHWLNLSVMSCHWMGIKYGSLWSACLKNGVHPGFLSL